MASTSACTNQVLGKLARDPAPLARLRCVPSRRPRLTPLRNSACCSTSAVVDTQRKTNDYNTSMKQQMGWGNLNPYEYHFERGLYYHEIDRNVICGSQPTSAEDISYLREVENVTTIINLQQDKDIQYWGVNFDSISSKCREVGMTLIRRPARDFDPHSLRRTLPSAVQALCNALQGGNGKVYVHCTAGLGRAPAVCIAFLYWFRGMSLDDAYKHLTSVRPCGPKKEAIRGATYDMLCGGDFDGFSQLPSDMFNDIPDEDRFALQYRVYKSAL